MLKAAVGKNGITQDSLARAMGKSQGSINHYLQNRGAGALDLDEASAALHHLGSSLMEFLKAVPQRTPTPAEEAVRALENRPELLTLIRDLQRVPKSKLSVLLDVVREVAQLASGPRRGPTGGSTPGAPQVKRTKRPPTRHR